MKTSLQQSGKAMLCAITAGLLRASRCLLALVSLGVLLPTMLLAVDLDVQYLGALPGSGSAYGMAVSGNFAYVAAGHAGFRVIDLTNWAKPKLGEYQTRGYATHVAVTGRYAYVTEGARFVAGNYVGGGLEVIDISDPANPRRIGEETNFVCGSIAVSGHYACVTSETNAFVIDISNPTHPQPIGSFDTSSGYRTLAAVGNFIYVADRETGLQIFDFSNPASPQRVGSYHASRDVVDVAVRGNFAYLAEAPLWDGTNFVGSGGLQVLDISDPTNPRPVGGYHRSEADHVQSVSVDGNYACVFGVGLIDISDPSNPKLAATLRPLNDDLNQAVLSGDFLYVPDYANDLHVFDIRTPANPQRIGSYEASVMQYIVSPGHQTALSGDYAYVLESEYLDSQGKRIRNSFQVIDLSNPAEPRRVNESDLGELDIRNDPTGLAVSGDYAYVTGYALRGDGARPGGGLQIIDVSSRANPHLVSVWKEGQGTAAVAISGHYAYVGLGGLAVVDVGDPTAPQQVGICTNVGADHLTVSGGFAYTVRWDTGLQVIDISDPTNPRPLGAYRAGYAHDVALSGSYAYLAERPRADRTNTIGGGLVILDVRDPLAPKQVGVYSAGGVFGTVAVSGNHAYVGDEWGGLNVIDVTNPAMPRRIGGNSAVSTSGIAASGGRLLTAAAGGHGLAVLDLFRGFRLDAQSPIASDAFRLRLDGPRGVPVRLQRSANLTDWQDWLPVTFGASPAEMADSSEGAAPRRFYRAVYP